MDAPSRRVFLSLAMNAIAAARNHRFERSLSIAVALAMWLLPV